MDRRLASLLALSSKNSLNKDCNADEKYKVDVEAPDCKGGQVLELSGRVENEENDKSSVFEPIDHS